MSDNIAKPFIPEIEDPCFFHFEPPRDDAAFHELREHYSKLRSAPLLRFTETDEEHEARIDAIAGERKAVSIPITATARWKPSQAPWSIITEEGHRPVPAVVRHPDFQQLDQLEFRLVDRLKTGQQRCAQVYKGTLSLQSSSEPPAVVVFKIFQECYFPLPTVFHPERGMHYGFWPDGAQQARVHTWAHQQLTSMQGKQIPWLYGVFKFNLPPEEAYGLVTEYVEGMLGYCVQLDSIWSSKDEMRKLAEYALSTALDMSERGVIHGDLMKQNLIIRQGDAKFPIVELLNVKKSGKESKRMLVGRILQELVRMGFPKEVLPVLVSATATTTSGVDPEMNPLGARRAPTILFISVTPQIAMFKRDCTPALPAGSKHSCELYILQESKIAMLWLRIASQMGLALFTLIVQMQLHGNLYVPQSIGLFFDAAVPHLLLIAGDVSHSLLASGRSPVAPPTVASEYVPSATMSPVDAITWNTTTRGVSVESSLPSSSSVLAATSTSLPPRSRPTSKSRDRPVPVWREGFITPTEESNTSHVIPLVVACIVGAAFARATSTMTIPSLRCLRRFIPSNAIAKLKGILKGGTPTQSGTELVLDGVGVSSTVSLVSASITGDQPATDAEGPRPGVYVSAFHGFLSACTIAADTPAVEDSQEIRETVNSVLGMQTEAEDMEAPESNTPASIPVRIVNVSAGAAASPGSQSASNSAASSQSDIWTGPFVALLPSQHEFTGILYPTGAYLVPLLDSTTPLSPRRAPSGSSKIPPRIASIPDWLCPTYTEQACEEHMKRCGAIVDEMTRQCTRYIAARETLPAARSYLEECVEEQRAYIEELEARLKVQRGQLEAVYAGMKKRQSDIASRRERLQEEQGRMKEERTRVEEERLAVEERRREAEEARLRIAAQRTRAMEERAKLEAKRGALEREHAGMEKEGLPAQGAKTAKEMCDKETQVDEADAGLSEGQLDPREADTVSSSEGERRDESAQDGPDAGAALGAEEDDEKSGELQQQSHRDANQVSTDRQDQPKEASTSAQQAEPSMEDDQGKPGIHDAEGVDVPMGDHGDEDERIPDGPLSSTLSTSLGPGESHEECDLGLSANAPGLNDPPRSPTSEEVMESPKDSVIPELSGPDGTGSDDSSHPGASMHFGTLTASSTGSQPLFTNMFQLPSTQGSQPAVASNNTGPSTAQDAASDDRQADEEDARAAPRRKMQTDVITSSSRRDSGNRGRHGRPAGRRRGARGH
ncbi:predicted protein [Postia placenta Mad-698-R]|nr:predicted protein [Postia placenta Mad-698-R]